MKSNLKYLHIILIILMVIQPITAQKSPSKKNKKQKTETLITIDSSSISAIPIKNIEPIIKYELYVKDKESKNPIPNCMVTLIGSDSISNVKFTDSKGIVVFDKTLSNDSLNLVWKFNCTVNQKEYFSFIYDTLVLKETSILRDTVELSFALGKIFKTPEIYFYDSRIDDSKHSGSYDSIMKLYNLLIMNPTMVIELQYNTDCRGSAKYNEALSLRHAKGVRDYLISKGIAPERIIPIGYGLNNPLPGLDCETIRKMTSKEDQEKAHQLNRRSEFKVLSFDFEPLPIHKSFLINQEIIVLDKETNKPIENAIVGFYYNGRGSRWYCDQNLTTNSEGKVVIDKLLSSDTLLSKWDFSFTAHKDGYLMVQKDKELSKGMNKFIDTIYLLNAIGKVFDLPTIQYAFNQWDLLVEEGRINSYDSLDYLYQILIDNPTLIVEIQNHTDCRGKPQYSTRLSQKRAQACVDYLVSKGIPKERLIAKGYGPTIPRKPGLDCETINKMTSKEEQEKAHQLNRRTQFKVLSFDYTLEPIIKYSTPIIEYNK